jgi:hypothetical protein
MRFYRAFPVFSAVFALSYLAVTYFNLALITYFPTQGELHFLVQRAKEGPSMFWYGWIMTAGLGAVALSAISLAVPDRVAARVSPVWIGVIAVAVMLVFIYLLRGWFLPSVGLILK